MQPDQKGKEKAKVNNDEGEAPGKTDKYQQKDWEPSLDSPKGSIITPAIDTPNDPYHGFEWHEDVWKLGSDQKPVFTVFFQGVNVSQRQLAQYTGDWGFVATTGERFTGINALQAIRFPFVGAEAPEVVLSKAHIDPTRDSPTLCFHPLLWAGLFCSDFTHELCGFRAAPMGCCLPPNSLSQASVSDMAFPSAPTTLRIQRTSLTAQRHLLRMDKINVGQYKDVEIHCQKWKALQQFTKQLHYTSPESVAPHVHTNATQAPESTPKEVEVMARKRNETEINNTARSRVDCDPRSSDAEPCILYGVSRGAAATLNALATHQYQNVRLVILEGCFTSVTKVIRNQFGSILSPLVEFGLSLATDYKPGHMRPIKSCAKISTQVPIGFVTSKRDTLVPPSTTMRLVEKLRRAGHEHVHVLTLRQSPHGRYVFTDAIDREAYLLWLHALYKHYDLPHIPDLAALGEPLLDEKPFGEQDKWFREHTHPPTSEEGPAPSTTQEDDD